MTTAVISNKIYLKADRELRKSLMAQLTYKIEMIRTKMGHYNAIETIRNFSIVKEDVIAIPQGRLDLIPKDYQIVDRRVLVPVEMPHPLVDPREAQQPVIDAWEGSGILNAKVGWGKTFTSLWIAFKLGQKTLVVTHNTMLRDQWIKEVEELFDIKPGVVSAEQFNIDAPIVIGNVQTLTKHAESLSAEFGTIILDEAHHCPAETFQNIIGASKAMYRIGLTGTLERRDRKHVLFKDFFGPVIVKPPQSDTLIPKIQLIKIDKSLTPGVSFSQKINHLMEDREYQDFIAMLAMTKIAKGHKVLIISERVEFAKAMEKLIPKCKTIAGFSSFNDRELVKKQIETDEVNVVSGTRPIFAEGISINCLSCIILTCPVAFEGLLEQLIGRVQRNYPGKITPEVCDVMFKGASEARRNNTRLAFYLSQGWEIETIQL